MLQSSRIAFEELQHTPVFTSEEAAHIRGATLASGAKALVVKTGERFVLLIIPADRKLDSKKAKLSLGIRELRFAYKEELLEQTGLTPGCIPPFGSLFSLPTYVDPALSEQSHINFNAGDHCVSFSMKWSDYFQVEQPILAVLTS